MGIQDEVQKLLTNESAKHKRMVAYVLRQVAAERPLAEILEDPYLTNRLTHIDQRALLDEPEIIEAVHNEVLDEMRENLEQAVRGSAHA